MRTKSKVLKTFSWSMFALLFAAFSLFLIPQQAKAHALHAHPPYFYSGQTILRPAIGNHRLSWCYKGNRGCGQRAAQAYCNRMGYKHASAFAPSPMVGPTKSIGDRRICKSFRCTGFRWVHCSSTRYAPRLLHQHYHWRQRHYYHRHWRYHRHYHRHFHHRQHSHNIVPWK